MSAPPAAPPAVEIRGLVKRHGGRAVVDRLDLTAEAGRVTAVLGPNGAGKTTTIECCEGLRAPDEGSVRVLGLDPQAHGRELRAQVGVMLQDSGLPTAVRALDMLRHVATMYAEPRDVAELVERLGLRDFAGTTIRRLSGGQRQRLALAIAIVGRPALVFLDEPSAGMDPQSRLAVWELVRELRDEGVAVVLTTHLMDEAESLADHVVVLDHGKVIAEGGVRDLVAAADDRTLRFEAPPALDLASLGAALATTGQTGPAPVVQEPSPGEYVLSGAVTPETLAALTAWSADRGVLVTRTSVGRRTLEDVFLDLTGRNLR
ncbi:ABC transporter ATP-binding protein [Cellulomonas chengniuliangii]|uniref:ABC transporter ATP-binding protein n=1 Tax=Cellulomonas chengniuliangii TaxID=2968084 RepID=A0ABY5KUD6_9CELL|nr:ABC transporter ATP-binding protein [Cellulomonas chengniuliangii]MCC2308705.1 ABC transporter ATP-binding protein [Cellulomonas chengniuliangii]MCC2317723.1 ABC transporter ATP-binding protein [Cellulomonas chengniuliangii]UUI74060.1 ABC transporter ATP-binding protein [Cellulomonas chengniuliangii]